MKNTLFSLALLGMLTACDKLAAVPPSPAQRVAYQKSIRMAGDALALKVAQIADSRCPINARCITAGSVKVQFEVGEPGASQALEVDLPAYPEKPVQKQFTVNGQPYQLTLRDVLPYPEAGKPVQLTDYSVEVAVDKL